MDMPSLLDHQEIVESYKAKIEAVQTEEHEIIGTRLADSSDFDSRANVVTMTQTQNLSQTDIKAMTRAEAVELASRAT